MKLDTRPMKAFIHNLSYKGRKVLQSLSQNSHIVIRPSDKGGSTVIMDRGLYEKFVPEMLSDKLIYRPY